MITYKIGDILQENTEAIINTVNCVGVMGRGIALQFKNRFPGNFKAYYFACKNNEVRPGHMFVHKINEFSNPKFIINFPTKRHWRDKSKIEDIESGLQSLVCLINQLNIQSIAIPPLGCGLGGLDWQQVKPKIEAALQSINKTVDIVIYEPNETPVTMATPYPTEKMTAGRAALIGLMNIYLKGLLDPFITLIEVHKLMYFMQEAGENLNLKFKKAPYGPYAENLRHVLQKIEGHFIHGYADGGDNPSKQLTLLPGAQDNAIKFLENHTETQTRFQQVSNLIKGFESPFGLELLSTVHWIIKKEGVHSIDDIIEYTYKWNNHKKQFTERQIKIAVNTLIQRDWIEKQIK
jgi:O-acetyl-ADP-ribose deacetylase (regulator of RNase III)